MNKSELFYRTKVPVAMPERFQLFLLTNEPAGYIESSITSVVRSQHIRSNDFPLIEINPLSTQDKDRFFEVLSLCNLTETEKVLANRLDTVVRLSVETNKENLYHSFWSLRKAAHHISQSVDATNMLVDLDQGNTVSAVLESVDGLKGIPLAKDYVTIKAYDGISDNTYVLESEGLVRFGLPEVALHEIPHNLGSDGAYLVRTVAQYLLAKLEAKETDLDYITVNEDVSIPCDYCEFNNPFFHGVNESLSAVSLNVDDSIINLQPCSDYDDYYDWLMEILDSVTQSRTKAHWIEERAGKEKIFV